MKKLLFTIVLALTIPLSSSAFTIYGTTTDASNYERIRITPAWGNQTNSFISEAAGYGTARPFYFYGAKFGIGTSSPYAELSVQGQIVGSYFTGTTTATSTFGGNIAVVKSSSPLLRFDDTGTRITEFRGQSASQGASIGTVSSHQFSFFTGGTNRMYLSTAGNLGIGTSTPYAKLSVTGTSGATTPLFAVASSTNVGLFNVLPNGNVGVGTSTPASLFSIQGIANQVLALFDVANSEFNSLFRINANGSVQNGFPSGTTTKQNMLSDPDNIASITAANYMATYSDDPSRLIMCGTAAGSNIHIRNKGFANASQLYVGTTAQTVTWTTLYNSVVVGRGCITAGGYHYVLYASTTSATDSAIRRATSSDFISIASGPNWATTTISGLTGTTSAFLIGESTGFLWIATTTASISKFAIATSTNTLTYAGSVALSGANVLINNTRVNDTGIYAGFSAAPFTRKYTLNGVAVVGVNIGVAVPSTTGPDMFATDRSLYGLYGNSTTLLSKVYGY